MDARKGRSRYFSICEPKSHSPRDGRAVQAGLAALGGDLVDDLLRLVAVHVVDDHRGAVLGQVDAVAAADPSRPTGDDRRLSVENPHVNAIAREVLD